MRATLLNPNARNIDPEVLDPDGRMRVLPASYWATTTVDERGLFGHRHGIYAFPTLELADWLTEIIGRRKAIEIGAGNGVLADHLGIVGTDSYQQDQANYATFYKASGQPTVKYGPNVIRSHASRAVRRYRPQVVIGCWVTHVFEPMRHAVSGSGGNEVGVDEADILANCQLYIHIGNHRIHGGKAIWARKHEIYYPDWLYSRSTGVDDGARDFIAVWRGGRN